MVVACKPHGRTRRRFAPSIYRILCGRASAYLHMGIYANVNKSINQWQQTDMTRGATVSTFLHVHDGEVRRVLRNDRAIPDFKICTCFACVYVRFRSLPFPYLAGWCVRRLFRTFCRLIRGYVDACVCMAVVDTHLPHLRISALLFPPNLGY